jgi:hypothetical protein
MRYLRKYNEDSKFKELVDNLFIDMIDRGCKITVTDSNNYCDIFNAKFIDSDITTFNSSEPAYHHILNMALKDKDTQFTGLEIKIGNFSSKFIDPISDQQDIECIKFANDYLSNLGYKLAHIACKKGSDYIYSIDIDILSGVNWCNIVYKLP